MVTLWCPPPRLKNGIDYRLWEKEFDHWYKIQEIFTEQQRLIAAANSIKSSSSFTLTEKQLNQLERWRSLRANTKYYAERIDVYERYYDYDLRTGKFDNDPSSELESRKHIAQLRHMRNRYLDEERNFR